ncbi:MAG: Na(+)/H(+) antiporter subunit D [Bacillota bacterium]|jgi:multicomponent Na+:H+ antiporter subunit D
MTSFHPALILIVAALLVYILPTRLRQAAFIGGPLLAILAVLSIETGTIVKHKFIGYDLIVLNADATALVFALIFTMVAFLGAMFALHLEKPGEQMAALLYAGGSLGVTFAGDWLTLFFFWELMSISSVFLIWYRGRTESLKAGFRYLVIHLIGGNSMLFGVLLLIGSGNQLVGSLTGLDSPAFWLVLLGVAINAAIPPLHAWLTDAYPEGTVTGSVFLSAFTTKVAVYVLVRAFPGVQLLLYLGVIMAIYGIVFAVLENDIRRLLSYHIVSQVGYMVAGVGIGTGLALNGSIAHAFSHILYKSLLFMGAGAVIYATGREKLTELGGIARAMPVTVITFAIAALSIAGAPLFNGFISKSIIVTAAGAEGLKLADFFLTLASVGTFLSIGLKLFYYMFFGEDRGLKPVQLPLNMNVAMVLGAFLCTLYGIYPKLLYDWLPFAMDYNPFTLDHIVNYIQLLLATGVAFWLYLSRLEPRANISLDFDWFYRKPLAYLFGKFVLAFKQVKVWLDASGINILHAATPYFANPFMGPLKVLWAVSPAAARGEREAAVDGIILYSEDRYRFPVGLSLLLAAIFLGLIATYILFLQ